MRFSTSTIYETGSTRLSDLQTALLKTQQQISANRRVLTPADDPIAAARALEVTQSQSLNTQYATNRGYATDSLNLEESVLSSVTTLLQDVQTQIVQAGNSAYDDTQRKYIATNLRGRLEELVGLANTRDSEGNYLFSGFQTSTQPFTSTTTGVTYAGDQGQRALQVGAVRQMSTSDSGSAVFQDISGKGTFEITSSTGSFDSTSLSSPLVTNASGVIAGNYTLSFDSSAVPTTYSVTGPAGFTTVTGNYTSGSAISFGGMQLTVSGTHTTGDSLSITATASSGGKSMFSSISDLIDALETTTTGVTGKSNLTVALATANDNIGSALDNVLTIRASTGARLQELESLDSAGSDRDLQYSDTLSKLQDLDYTKAISQLALQKTTLDAAQQSFLKLMNLSLFNYMG